MGSSLRHLPISATLGMLLVGCGPALGQSAPSGSPSFQERIKEVARALQNQPSLKDLSEQQRIDRVEFVVGNTLFILLHDRVPAVHGVEPAATLDGEQRRARRAGLCR